MSTKAEPQVAQMLQLAENNFVTTVSILKNLEEKTNKTGEKMKKFRNVPGGPAVETLCFHFRGPGLTPGWRTKGAPQVALVVKNSPAIARDVRDIGSIPGSGRSFGVGNGNPLHYSCLENPMDRGAWEATVHRVAKSRTRLKRLSTQARTCGTKTPYASRPSQKKKKKFS